MGVQGAPARPAGTGGLNDQVQAAYRRGDVRPANGGKQTRPLQPPTANRGLIGQIEDAYSRPLDFSEAQRIALPGGALPVPQGTNFAGLPALPSFRPIRGVGAMGRTAPLRERGDLATRLEGMYRRYGEDYGAFRDAVGDLDRRFALSGPGDFGAERESVERAVYDRAYGLLAPELERQERALETDLANRGLAPTSEAYRDLRGQYDQQRAQDLSDLSLASVLAGAQEHQRLADLVARNRGQVFGEQAGLFGAGGEYYGGGLQNVGAIDALNQAEEAEMARVRQASLQAGMFNAQLQQSQQELEFQRALAARELAAREGAQRFGEGVSLRGMFGNERDRLFNQQARLRQQQIAEQTMRRQQPVQDLMSLVSGISPGGLPQMPGFTNYAIQAPDYMGLVGSNYAARAGRPSGKGGFLGGLGSLAQGAGALGGSGLFSDRRLKEDIARVGVLDNGLPVYVYRFKGDPRTFMGLMADEVEKIRPEAVSTAGNTDLKTVDYRKAAV